MINHSTAYETFKRSMQQQLDFIVLVSYAVPVLLRNITLAKGATPPVPIDPADHFVQRRLAVAQLEQFALDYEHELARTLVLASFSYFEAYVKALIREMLAFHGGAETFLNVAIKRSQRSLAPLGPRLAKAKRKLQEPAKRGKTPKYSVYSSELVGEGFRFPSELLSAYGAARLLEKVGNDKRLEMKANEIPKILVDAFHMDGFLKHKKAFDDLRTLRNEIAHGHRQKVTLKKAIAAGRSLREWANAIDRHFVEHFFVLERFAR